MSDAPQKVSSMDELAALMTSNRQKMIDEGKYPSANEPPARLHMQPTDEDQSDETIDPNLSQDDDDTGVSDDDAQPNDDRAANDEDTAGSPDEEDQGGDAQEDALDDDDPDASQPADDQLDFTIDDEDLIEIEGLEEPVSFKTLKDVYQADKTIQQNVEAAQQHTQAASDTYRQTQEEAVKVHTAMKALIEGIEGIMTQPLVSKPDAALKTTDAARYLQHLEAYEQDQQRINQSRQTVLDALDAHRTQAEEMFNNRKKHELSLLTDKLPALKSEETQKQASKDILDGAAYFGFTPEEINQTADHRLFLMAHMAQQYLKITSQSKEEKEEKVTNVRKRISSQPRVLRSGNSKPRATLNQKEVKRIKNVAKKSGKPADVAAYMASRRQAT